jgi:hypothetical protein
MNLNLNEMDKETQDYLRDFLHEKPKEIEEYSSFRLTVPSIDAFKYGVKSFSGYKDGKINIIFDPRNKTMTFCRPFSI